MRPLTVSIEEAAGLLGISRSTAYAVAQSGWLTAGVRVLRIGTRMRVPVVDLERLLGPIDWAA